ncbi:MAG TPA: acyl-CoA dehydrogenase family protein [Labilithrix sp.]|nr:acyl-CoA dehydrogenase family protein [Labilithrix sp.]
MDALEHVLRAPPPTGAVVDMASWLAVLSACPFERSIDRALWAGFEADRLGYAFVGGYQAALARLFTVASKTLGDPVYAWPSRDTRLCLAATESGGAHPRAIETSLFYEDPALRLRGEKTFATLASAADELLVVASRGPGADGKNRLALVRVRSKSAGVVIEDRRATPFAPEVPHAKVSLLDVVVHDEDVLPGDGYAVYLKPFRTIEDAHVLAAALGHVLRTARAHDFDPAVKEGVVALIVALMEIAERDPGDPVVHVALSGLFREARRLIADGDREWEKSDADTRDRWRRDLGLLVVAETARQQRTEAAWKTLAARGDPR